jgi:hypothetical protein
MKLTELATKPQLIKVILDDEDIVEEYKEPLEFYVWDKQPISKFLKYAQTSQDSENYGELVDFCTELVLDEEGNAVIQDGVALPSSVMIKCINKVVEQLGK